MVLLLKAGDDWRELSDDEMPTLARLPWLPGLVLVTEDEEDVEPPDLTGSE